MPFVFCRDIAGVLEQVSGFGQVFKRGMFENMSPLDYFIQRLEVIKDDSGKQVYTGIEAIEMEGGLWIDVPRSRLHCNLFCCTCLREARDGECSR